MIRIKIWGELMFDLREEAKVHRIVAAHRGIYGGNIPCNTLAAFQSALTQKADMIELDVTKSADNTVFVFHEGCERLQLGTDKPVSQMRDKEIRELRYRNVDGAITQYPVPTLDETFELLKGKCYINLDKFERFPAETIACVKSHDMMDQIVVKTPAKKMQLDIIENLAPQIPYIVIVNDVDEVTGSIEQRNINFVGVEATFISEASPVAQESYIKALHDKGLLAWGNGIVFNYQRILSAGHTDDISMMGYPDDGWGWLARHGFDIIQTDWPLQLSEYLVRTGLYYREGGTD